MSADIRDTSRRAPPAFQMYAASRLADRDFRSAAAVERGVLHSMELECWVNGTIPRDPRALARVLGLDAAEVQAGLTQRVLRHFQPRHDDLEGEVLVHPELDAYRAKLDTQYENRADAGRRNIARVNERKRAGNSTSDPTSNPSSVSTSPKYSTEQYSQNQSLESGSIPQEHKEWLSDYEGAAPHEGGSSC